MTLIYTLKEAAIAAGRGFVGAVQGLLGVVGSVAQSTTALASRTEREFLNLGAESSRVMATRVLAPDQHEWLRTLLARVVEATLGLLGYEKVLGYAQNIVQGAGDIVFRSLVIAAAKRSLSAMRLYLVFSPVIWEAMLSNPTNKETLKFILHTRADLASFLIDLVEPMKRFVAANSPGNNQQNNDQQDDVNNYNELNLEDQVNKYAVVSQLQRTAKSLVAIFKDGAQNKNLGDFDMDTTLESDRVRDTQTKTIDEIKWTHEKPETWFFVNGIGGELYWQKLAIKKL
jgi:hypothetical protein